MTIEKVRPGVAWRPPKAVDTNIIAKAVDEWLRTSELGRPARRLPIVNTTDVIKVQNLTSNPRSLGDVLEVGDSLLNRTDRLNLAFQGNTPNNGERFAILRDPANTDETVTAQIAGIAQARINVLDQDHTCATPKKGEHELQSSDFGPFRIWWKPSGTGIQDCIVLLDSPSGTVIALTPSGGIPARSGSTVGSAACVLYTIDENDLLVAMTNAASVAISKPVKNVMATAITGAKYILATIETSGNLCVAAMDCT